MDGRAVAKFVRVSTRKARIVANLVRGKEVEEALRAQTGRGNILEGEGQKESRENHGS